MKNLKDIISEKLIINKHSKVKKDIDVNFINIIDEFIKKYNFKDLLIDSKNYYIKTDHKFNKCLKEKIFDTWNKGTKEDQKIFTDEILQYCQMTFNWPENIGIDIYITTDNFSHHEMSSIKIMNTDNYTDIMGFNYKHDTLTLEIIYDDDNYNIKWILGILEYMYNN